MIGRIFIILLFSSNLQARERADFNELRLKAMSKVINARDYELLLTELNQFEILDLACSKELENQKLPVSCFELQYKMKKKGWRYETSNFEFTDSCQSRLVELSDADLQSLKPKKQFLPISCQNLIDQKLKILAYKKGGKNLE